MARLPLLETQEDEVVAHSTCIRILVSQTHLCLLGTLGGLLFVLAAGLGSALA